MRTVVFVSTILVVFADCSEDLQQVSIEDILKIIVIQARRSDAWGSNRYIWWEVGEEKIINLLQTPPIAFGFHRLSSLKFEFAEVTLLDYEGKVTH